MSEASIDRPWLASYPAHVPPAVETTACRSLVAMLQDTCERCPQRPAFTHLGVTLTFADGDAKAVAGEGDGKPKPARKKAADQGSLF